MIYKRFDEVFETTNYPAGEWQLRCVDSNVDVIECADVRNFDGLAKLVEAHRLVPHAQLFVPYFPFAREDKARHRCGMPLKQALWMVRHLGIIVADPHSEATGLRHIEQSKAVRCFRRAGAFSDRAMVAIPDAGATRKADSWIGSNQSVQCSKVRDPATGKLSGFHVAGDVAYRDVVIVDDICDGGGTFLGLAGELHMARSLTLCVTHGAFTKGVHGLLGVFDRIYTFGHPAEHDPRIFATPWRTLYEEGTS